MLGECSGNSLIDILQLSIAKSRQMQTEGTVTEHISRIDDFGAKTIRAEGQDELAWAGPMRLFQEKIVDHVAGERGIERSEFRDNHALLSYLNDSGVLSSTDYMNLDSIRWVCNQILHDTGEATSADCARAWASFRELSRSKFWLQGPALRRYDPQPIKLPKITAGGVAKTVIVGAAILGAIAWLSNTSDREESNDE